MNAKIIIINMYSDLTMYLVIYLSVLLPFISSNELESVISDSVFYHITWPGKFVIHPKKENRESVIISTAHNEQYRCTIPDKIDRFSHDQALRNYRGKTPRELLDPLFSQTSCSYRIESYWTYELCHGKSIRQYHEEMDTSKSIKVQEYFLGRYKNNIAQEMTENNNISPESLKKRSIHINNNAFPYVSINMTDGTVCDISNQPRRSRLLYICQEDGRGEVYEIKETSSCNYDVIVFTKILCTHPAFRPHVILSNNIECFAMDGSSRRPLDLDRLEVESGNARVPHVDPVMESTNPIEVKEKMPIEPVQRPIPQPEAPEPGLADMISGRHCFTGGRGWWLNEFCMNRIVRQFHVDHKTGKKDEIVLGSWNLLRHKDWLKENPAMKFEKGSNLVHLYYTNGDFCELLSDYRAVVVKLICSNQPKSSLFGFKMKLDEPSPCRYMLSVESDLLCSIFDHIDEEAGVPTLSHSTSLPETVSTSGSESTSVPEPESTSEPDNEEVGEEAIGQGAVEPIEEDEVDPEEVPEE